MVVCLDEEGIYVIEGLQASVGGVEREKISLSN